MSGPWDKYVEQVVDVLLDCDHNGIECSYPMSLPDAARAILAAVGPLIQEDARERMVAAAGAALEREGACSERAKVAEEWPAWIDPEDGFNFATGVFTGLVREDLRP